MKKGKLVEKDNKMKVTAPDKGEAIQGYGVMAFTLLANVQLKLQTVLQF